MKNKVQKVALMATAAMLLPLFSHAQGVAANLQSLQGILNDLYNQMIPLCSQMIGIGQGIAGFAALWYIAVRVWKHIAAAEPVDFYPLLRPFAIGFCIMTFPAVLAMINGVLQPTVTATASMVTGSNQAIETMLNSEQQQQTAPNQGGSASTNADPDKWYQYSHPDNSSSTGANTNPIADQFSGFGIKHMIKEWIYEFLNVLFEAAALCIDTIRTFKLIVLAILGPLCFGLSVFDGFQHTLKQWLARYINVFMWLPVANIFGAIIAKIQVNMMQMHQAGVISDRGVNETNSVYLIFLVIGIVGYFTVPSIANYIINVGGHALFSKTGALASMAVSYAGGAIIKDALIAKALLGKTNSGQPSENSASGSGGGNSFNKDRLSGKT